MKKPTLPFSIGNPRQKFIGIFDTSSPLTWVMSEKCNSSACLEVPDNKKYRPDDSSTNFKFPLQVDMTYLDGSHVRVKPELVSTCIYIYIMLSNYRSIHSFKL